jgi:hypothetical protein
MGLSFGSLVVSTAVPSRVGHFNPLTALWRIISILVDIMEYVLCDVSIAANNGSNVKSYVLPEPVGKLTPNYTNISTWPSLLCGNLTDWAPI